jgi:hypothetical protein
MTKLLIDECLSAELALMARERGHHQASHVVWIGKAGWKDWELKQLLLDEDWVLVTWNSKDFRGLRHLAHRLVSSCPRHLHLLPRHGPRYLLALPSRCHDRADGSPQNGIGTGETYRKFVYAGQSRIRR